MPLHTAGPGIRDTSYIIIENSKISSISLNKKTKKKRNNKARTTNCDHDQRESDGVGLRLVTPIINPLVFSFSG